MKWIYFVFLIVGLAAAWGVWNKNFDHGITAADCEPKGLKLNPDGSCKDNKAVASDAKVQSSNPKGQPSNAK
ncbi:hypothetical protein [Chromobacterium violaceum]|uniref:hypothetical protein n=1 Tax=Chromobacterium violaceum TaxID=536 RepID=UPI0012D35CF6|nr:hypothetical protein [Chromobacterium violaceum]